MTKKEQRWLKQARDAEKRRAVRQLKIRKKGEFGFSRALHETPGTRRNRDQ
jgi:hypothetical protein